LGAIAEGDAEIEWPHCSRNGGGRRSRRCPGGHSLLLDRHWRIHPANKGVWIRAALCADAETAKGARVWNDANVLALSLRSTSEAVAKEILDAWYSTPYSDDEWNKRQIERITSTELLRLQE